jgi:hypothetical protein
MPGPLAAISFSLGTVWIPPAEILAAGFYATCLSATEQSKK